MSVTERLRRGIEASPKSRRQLGQQTGIDPAVLCRFVHGQGQLSAEGIDAMAKALGLELVAKRPTKAKARKPKTRTPKDR